MKSIAGKRLLIFLLAVFLVPSLWAESEVITVLDFQTKDISESDMKVIVSLLSASVFDTGMYTVIDISQRDTILKELQFSLSGCSDESCQLEAGMMLSAELIVVGDLARVGSRYILNARIIVTETGATVKAYRGIYPDMDELVDDIPGFALNLTGEGDLPETEDTSESEEMEKGVVEDDEPEAEIIEPSSVSMEPKTGFFDSVGGFPPQGDTASWLTLGAGTVLTGTGIWLLASSLIYKSETLDPSYDEYMDDSAADYGGLSAEEYYDALWTEYENNLGEFRTRIIIASGVTAAGIGSLVVSRYLFRRYNETHDSRISFVIRPGFLEGRPAVLSWNLSCRGGVR